MNSGKILVVDDDSSVLEVIKMRLESKNYTVIATAEEEHALEAVREQALSRKKDAHIAVLGEEGGSLYFLALNHFKKANGTLFELILQANPSITDVRQIDDHQEIIVPVITAESYIKKIPGGDYRVYIGTFATYAIAAAYSQKVGSAEKLIFIDSRNLI